jgi:serine/threonine protein kinase
LSTSESSRSASPTLEELFASYLERATEYDSARLARLYASAGEHGPALRARVEMHLELLSLSRALPHELGTGTPAAPHADPERLLTRAPGEEEAIDRLGRFEILRSLGEGGLSSVYLARDPRLGREVALKVLDRGLRLSNTDRAFVLNEARSLARLNHPGVVRVYEVCEEGGVDCVLMEHVRGPALSEVIEALAHGLPPAPEGCDALALERHERLANEVQRLRPYTARVALIAGIARALAYCHAMGVVHRDVKPANVLVCAGAPVLIDFGLAHVEGGGGSLGVTRRLVGTAAYIAPEQAETSETGANPLSDQFSLGAVFYELLALRSAFAAGTRTQTMNAVARARAVPLRSLALQLPPEVALMCQHCLERRPEDRYPSVDRLANDLEAWIAHRPISIAPPSPLRRLALWSRRNWVALSASASISLLVGGSLVAQHLRHLSSARAELERELESVRTRADSNIVDFELAYPRLFSARQRAAQLDARLLARWAGPPLGERVEQAVRTCGEALEQSFDALLQARLSAQAPPPDPRSDAPREPDRRLVLRGLWSQWNHLFVLDSLLRPGAGADNDWRNLGKTDLPTLRAGERAQLFTYSLGPRDHVDSLQALDWAPRLGAGLYRVQCIDALGRLSGECDFYVDDLAPRRRIELHPFADLWAPQLRRFDRGSWELPRRSAARSPMLEPDDFDILAAPLRWEHVLAALGNAPAWVAPHERDRLAQADYVRCSASEALELCHALGARLPTLAELYVAYASGLLDALPDALIGEHVAGHEPEQPDAAWWVEYERLSANESSNWPLEVVKPVPARDAPGFDTRTYADASELTHESSSSPHLHGRFGLRLARSHAPTGIQPTSAE